MANVKNNVSSQHTQRCLLEAAGEVFAEQGYHAATIKEITERAGASLASVNYHFRDKSELYAAVLHQIGERIVEKIPPDEKLTGNPAMRFRQFIQWYCLKAFDATKSPWESILLAREVAQPTEAYQRLLEKCIRPLFDKLSVLVAELLGTPVTDEAVGLASASVLGQCSYILRHLRHLETMHPQLGKRPDVRRLVSHVADFSLAGLRSLSRGRRKGRRHSVVQ